MSELQFLQMLIGSLFGVSMFVKMWKHSLSTFLMLASSTFALFFYALNPLFAISVFSTTIVYVTARGAMKPIGERVWK